MKLESRFLLSFHLPTVLLSKKKVTSERCHIDIYTIIECYLSDKIVFSGKLNSEFDMKVH